MSDTKINLCETCRNDFATCPAKNCKYGDGVGNDNVIACDSYEISQRSPNRHATKGDAL